MAENLANRLIGLLVTLAIIAAIYLFAIKPILDTTNEAFNSFSEPFNGISNEIQNSFDEAGLQSFDVDSITISGNNERAKAQRLLECVQRVQPNTTKMQACVERYQ